MGRFQAGWQLGLRSWGLLRRDSELLWLPVLAGLAVVAIVVALGLPGLLLQGDGSIGAGSAVLYAAALVGANFVATLAGAAVVAGALQRLNGSDPTVRRAFAAAWARKWPIFQWSLVSTVVSLLISLIEERAGVFGRISGWLLDVAWAVATAFALPSIVVEGAGPVDALKSSASLVKARWGAAVGTYAGASVLFVPAYLVLIVVALGLEQASAAVGIGVGVVGFLVLAVLSACVSGIARAALYQYATTGASPLIDAPLAKAAFQPRRRTGGFGGGGLNSGGFSGRGR